MKPCLKRKRLYKTIVDWQGTHRRWMLEALSSAVKRGESVSVDTLQELEAIDVPLAGYSGLVRVRSIGTDYRWLSGRRTCAPLADEGEITIETYPKLDGGP